MTNSTPHRFFVPWFTVLLGLAVVGGVIAGSYFYSLYELVGEDPERQETLMRFVVVSFGVAPVLLMFRWFALRGRT
jgi:F0F1-type ATP synthase membrane subunit c/vacuolar-type H+-ATPase subunit K